MSRVVDENKQLLVLIENALDNFFSGSITQAQSIDWKEMLDGEELLIVCNMDSDLDDPIDHIVYISDGVRQRARHRSFDFVDSGKTLNGEQEG